VKPLPQPAEPTTNGLSGIGLAAAEAAEERPLRVLQHKPLGQIDHRRRQVNYAGITRAFAGFVLLGREHSGAKVDIYVGGRDSPGLARPAAGF
jgi:hypothetical protein